MYMMNALGITAGAHRLWTHRSYRAKLPVRIFLAICNSMAFQNDIIEWSRDHRVHHKYSETNADPHNAKRGFFFAHCGWLMVRKHPDVKEKGKNIDMSDLLNDPVCAMQRRFYIPSVMLLCFILPTVIPWYFWNESIYIAYFVPGVLRYVAALNCTWLVNSAAHMWGNKPYDANINPAQNVMVTIGAIGEGFHNYHHVFPSDYSTSEYGWRLNLTTMFIDLMALIGQVDQRRKMSNEAVTRRRERTGDGTDGFGYLPTDESRKRCSAGTLGDFTEEASTKSY
jgi:stearoyl-CoA desaturase (delta-9 desaturase)